jgi:hypothetical protein
MELSRRLFVLSAIVLVFGYGVAVGRYEIFPFSLIQFGWASVAEVVAERDTLLGVRPTWLLEPSRYDGQGVTRLDRDRAVPGLTLLAGVFDNELALRLIALDGRVVRHWPARFDKLFPSPHHLKPPARAPKTNWNTGVQGCWIFPDGSVLFNFEGLGSVRLERCGDVRWTLAEMTHHSVDVSVDGSFWIPALRYLEDRHRYPGLTPPFDEDVILKVSPDGKVLTEIAVLDLLFKNGLQPVLFANGLATTNVPGTHTVVHLNDVEELKPDLAGRFPQFAAGDLLLSLRNYNLVMVVDPATGKVKWHQTGPWVKQHDPNFEASGVISVFSNNSDGTEDGAVLGGSTIIDIDPRSRHAVVRYGGRPGQRLFTNRRGKHQRLSNGHELITESHAGRVIEVTPGGDIVWEFINRYDAKSVAIVSGATRFPESYFTVTDWTCE